MRLIYSRSPARREVTIGDMHILRDGYAYKITRIEEPHKPSSTGRVYIERIQAPHDTKEVFPVVIHAEWIEREDHV